MASAEKEATAVHPVKHGSQRFEFTTDEDSRAPIISRIKCGADLVKWFLSTAGFTALQKQTLHEDEGIRAFMHSSFVEDGRIKGALPPLLAGVNMWALYDQSRQKYPIAFFHEDDGTGDGKFKYLDQCAEEQTWDSTNNILKRNQIVLVYWADGAVPSILL